VAVFLLYAHKTVHNFIQTRRQMSKIFMESITNGKGGEYSVVHQSRTKISESARGVLTCIFVEMTCNKVICNKQVLKNGGTDPPFLTSALHVDEWSAPCPSHFTPSEKATGTHWIGGWVGPSLDTVEKREILHCRGSYLGHPAHSYTD
jgi:hypothetical protein